mgnify:CR=1 FL=1|jgi:hypothetical protein
MIGAVAFFIMAGLVDGSQTMSAKSWSMRSPTKETISTEITCGEQEYSASYGYSSREEIKGNRVFIRRDPVKLLGFSTNAFEVTPVLIQQVEAAISAYSYLDNIDLGCGWQIDEEEADFLNINIVGRHKGDHTQYREKCWAEDGLFFDETTRKYILKDGIFYDMNKTDKLGHCVYGQEFFTIDLENDE